MYIQILRTFEVIKIGLIFTIFCILLSSTVFGYIPIALSNLTMSVFREYPFWLHASPTILIFCSYFCSYLTEKKGKSLTLEPLKILLQKNNSVLEAFSSIFFLLGLFLIVLLTQIVQPTFK